MFSSTRDRGLLCAYFSRNATLPPPFRHLSLAGGTVQEAIAYCESNPPELFEDYAREEALIEASGMNDPNYKHHGKPKILTANELARIYRPKSS
jgi:hypothetical protein